MLATTQLQSFFSSAPVLNSYICLNCQKNITIGLTRSGRLNFMVKAAIAKACKVIRDSGQYIADGQVLQDVAAIIVIVPLTVVFQHSFGECVDAVMPAFLGINRNKKNDQTIGVICCLFLSNYLFNKIAQRPLLMHELFNDTSKLQSLVSALSLGNQHPMMQSVFSLSIGDGIKIGIIITMCFLLEQQFNNLLEEILSASELRLAV